MFLDGDEEGFGLMHSIEISGGGWSRLVYFTCLKCGLCVRVSEYKVLYKLEDISSVFREDPCKRILMRKALS